MILVDHRGARTEMPEAELLGPFEGGYENDNEIARWYELYICKCHGEIVKKSLDLHLKTTLLADLFAGQIG